MALHHYIASIWQHAFLCTAWPNIQPLQEPKFQMSWEIHPLGQEDVI
jgi:hypothetical protein